MKDLWLQARGVRLHAMAAGPESGPLVILLHGFPEFWYCWHAQLDALAVAGFYAVALDQRGYNLSDKPADVSAYAFRELAADVMAVATELGREKFSLVGHDLGGMVAWWVAGLAPARVAKLAILNAPHPAATRALLRAAPRQYLRSWYIGAFQLPRIPEAYLSAHNYQRLVDGLAASSRPGAFSPADFAAYRAAWSQPGALSAMLNWYRAPWGARDASRRVVAPTLILWGKRDRFIETAGAAVSADLCDAARVHYFDEATHWLQHEEVATINRLLVDHLRV